MISAMAASVRPPMIPRASSSARLQNRDPPFLYACPLPLSAMRDAGSRTTQRIANSKKGPPNALAGFFFIQEKIFFILTPFFCMMPLFFALSLSLHAPGGRTRHRTVKARRAHLAALESIPKSAKAISCSNSKRFSITCPFLLFTL